MVVTLCPERGRKTSRILRFAGSEGDIGNATIKVSPLKVGITHTHREGGVPVETPPPGIGNCTWPPPAFDKGTPYKAGVQKGTALSPGSDIGCGIEAPSWTDGIMDMIDSVNSPVNNMDGTVTAMTTLSI